MTQIFSRFSPEFLAASAMIVLFVLIVIFFVARKLIKNKKPKHFRDDWRNLQKKLPNKEKWGEAILEADKLLDDALKKQKIKGDSTGERIVNAQKIFTDNDAVWYGHKLKKKIEEKPNLKLEKDMVVKALLGLRQGIKDLGAFDGKK